MRLLYLAVVQQHGRQEWKEFLLPHMGSIQGTWDLTWLMEKSPISLLQSFGI